MSYVSLTASKKAAPAGKKLREVSPNKRLTVSLMLPTRASDEAIMAALVDVQTGKRPALSPREREELLGARAADVRVVHKTARACGLSVHTRTRAMRTHGICRVAGTYAAFQNFHPELKLHVYEDEHGNQFIGRESTINVREGLPILGVFGFDDREAARTHHRVHRGGRKGIKQHALSGLTTRGLAALQGRNLAEMDSIVRVTGFLSLGGDLIRIVDDLKTLASEAGINVPLTPRISTDGVANGAYLDDATLENVLDLLAQALLNPNGAVLQFQASNTDDSFAGSAEYAITYKGVKIGKLTYRMNVLTISWGMNEAAFTEQSLMRWARIAISANLGGIDIIAATGDTGPKDNSSDYTPDAPSCVAKDGAAIMGAAGIGFTTSADEMVSLKPLSARSIRNLIAVLNRGVGGEVRAALESAQATGARITSIFPWNDSEDSETGYGISALFPPIDAEKNNDLPVSVKTGKPGHSASVLCDVARPSNGPMVLWNGRRPKVGGTSHSAPKQGAEISFLKIKYNIPVFVPYVYKHGPEIVDKITRGDSSAPYPADPKKPYNVMTGYGVLNPNKVGAAVTN